MRVFFQMNAIDKESQMNKCSDIMTKDPVCCLPGDPVDKVAQLMGRENIGPVLIIEDDKDRKLVGIVTDRDLALKIVAEGRDPKSTRVGDVMTSNVVTVKDSDDLQLALDKMTQLQLRRIPVLDSGNKLVGILAQADVATRVNQPQTTADVVKGISQSCCAQD